MITVVTYESADACCPEMTRAFASLFEGRRPLPMMFYAPTQDEARLRAKTWLDEQARREIEKEMARVRRAESRKVDRGTAA